MTHLSERNVSFWRNVHPQGTMMLKISRRTPQSISIDRKKSQSPQQYTSGVRNQAQPLLFQEVYKTGSSKSLEYHQQKCEIENFISQTTHGTLQSI